MSKTWQGFPEKVDIHVYGHIFLWRSLQLCQDIKICTKQFTVGTQWAFIPGIMTTLVSRDAHRCAAHGVLSQAQRRGFPDTLANGSGFQGRKDSFHGREQGVVGTSQVRTGGTLGRMCEKKTLILCQISVMSLCACDYKKKKM